MWLTVAFATIALADDDSFEFEPDPPVLRLPWGDFYESYRVTSFDCADESVSRRDVERWRRMAADPDRPVQERYETLVELGCRELAIQDQEHTRSWQRLKSTIDVICIWWVDPDPRIARYSQARVLWPDGPLDAWLLDELAYLDLEGRARWATALVAHDDDVRGARAAVWLGDRELTHLRFDEALGWYALAERVADELDEAELAATARAHAVWLEEKRALED